MKILASVVATVALISSILPLQAGEPVKYPAEEPAFAITLPEKWTATPNAEGQLLVAANDDSGFTVTILPADEGDLKTDEDTKAYLPKLAQTMADSATLKDVKLSDLKTLKNDKGITFNLVNGTGNLEGKEFKVTAAAFAPTAGDYYVILCAVPADVDSAHGKQMGEILKSMVPVE